MGLTIPKNLVTGQFPGQGVNQAVEPLPSVQQLTWTGMLSGDEQ